MREVIIIDTGPLVAFYDERDPAHDWALRAIIALTEEGYRPFLTCEPVLTEAAFLLGRARHEPVQIVRAVRQGTLRPALEIADEAAALEVLMKRYADTPMALADACLVRLSELHKHCRVLTLDRHFKHYRRFGRSVIPLLSPW